VHRNVHKCESVCGIVKINLNNETRSKNQFNFHEVMYISSLFYGYDFEF
jgi:hypothetical protein